MKVKTVLIIMIVAMVHTSKVSDDTEVTTNDDALDVSLPSSSEERYRLRPIFPKSVQKFLTNTKPIGTKNITSAVQKPSKKEIFKIVHTIAKMKNKNNWRTTTGRPSLMKHTKYTIDPLNSFNRNTFSIKSNKQSDKYEEIERKHKFNQFRRKINAHNKDDSSEETLEGTVTNDRHKDYGKRVKTFIRRFHNLRSKINKDKYAENIPKLKRREKLETHNNGTTEKPNESEFSSEEKEDRNEFIFVTPKKVQERIVPVTDDSNESAEITTGKDIKLRRKRSTNVIEEENLGTTVSGFKFTGKITSLSSNLVFRNINT